MARKMREPKYKCQYCERPLDNLTTKTSHELACPKNPKNIKVESKERPPGSESNNSAGQTALVPKPETKGGKKSPPKKKPPQNELQEEDELLRQYPTIANLRKEVEQLKLIPGVLKANQEATQGQIGQLGDAIGKLNVVMAGIANRMTNSPQVEKVNQEKVPLSQGSNQADEALAASLAADKEKIGQTPGEEGTDPGGKMEKLRKEAEEKKLAGSGQPGQVQTGGVDLSLGAMGDMPEGLQKIMPYILLADKLGFLNKLKGAQPEQVQTPDDMKMIERVYANMTSVFNGALKLTQGFRVDARKEVMGEIIGSYNLTPKVPPAKEETKQEGQE